MNTFFKKQEIKDKEPFHFQVNLGGMLDILSNHLYKSPDVFVRELLQNGIDAITLRQKEQPGWKGPHMGNTTIRWLCMNNDRIRNHKTG